jgi:hypothetical protein
MAGFHEKSLRLLPTVPEMSEAAVVKVADAWPLDDVGKAFWSNTDEGEAALARIAAGMVTR